MTIAEFERLPESDHYLFELSRGVLVREPRPGAAHGTAVVLLAHHLAAWAFEHGGIVTSETGYVLAEDPDTLRGPDIAWMRADSASYRAPVGFIPRAPDLAVEVLSPSNRAGEIREKIDEYFEAGTSQVWLVDPRRRTVQVFGSPGASRTLGPSDTLDGGDLLPAFSIPVSEIFRF